MEKKNNTFSNILKRQDIQRVIFFILILLFFALFIAAENFIFTDTTGRLAVSIIMSLAVITIIAFVTARAKKREKVVGRLNSQIISAAGFYITLSDIDVIRLTITQIKSSDSGFIDQFIDENNSVQENLFAIMNGMPDNPTKKAAVDFVDLSTLDERMADKNNISLEYLSYNDKWVKGRFVVSERTPEGQISHVLWMIEDIDAEKRERDKLAEQSEKLTAQLFAAADIYISLCDLDIIDNSVTAIKNANPAIAKAVNACDHNMQDIFFGIMRGLPESPTKQAARQFCDLSDIDEKMRNKNTITLEYLSYGNIWVRARYVVSERNETGKITHVLWMLENIDAEKRARDHLYETAEKLNEQMSSIANIYMSVYSFDLENDTFSEIRAVNRQVTGIIGENRENAQQTLREVMTRMTDDSYLEQVLDFIDLSTLEERMDSRNTITIEYISKDKQRRRGRFIESGRNARGELNHVLWLVEDVKESE